MRTAIVVFLTSLVLLCASNATEVKVKGKIKERVSPLFFGVNTLYWLQNDETRKNPILNEYLKKLNIDIMRYPGGEVADNFNWKKNTLDDSKEFPYSRKKTDPITRMDFDEFVSWKSSLGSEAIIVVNLEQGFIEGDIEKAADEAAEWVRYANITKGYGIKYWEIGNESYHLGTRYSLSARQYAKAYKIFYEKMKKVDPTIKIGAIGPFSPKKISNIEYLTKKEIDILHSFTRVSDRKRYIKSLHIPKRIKKDKRIKSSVSSWWSVLAQEIGGYMDFAVVHRYSSHRLHNHQIDKPLHYDRPIKKLRRFLSRRTGRDIPIALTEWSFAKPSDMTGIYKSLTLAEMFGDYLKSGLYISCYFMLYKSKPTYRALFDHKTLQPKPIYYVFQAFSNLTNQNVLSTKVEKSSLYVLSTAGVNMKEMTLFLINKKNKQDLAKISLPSGYHPVQSWEIDKDDLTLHTLHSYPHRPNAASWSIELDPLSLTIIRFTK